MLRFSTSVSTLLFCAATAHAGNVLVVAPTGAAFPNIQSAIIPNNAPGTWSAYGW